MFGMKHITRLLYLFLNLKNTIIVLLNFDIMLLFCWHFLFFKVLY